MTILCKCRVCGFEFAYSGLFGGNANIVMQGSSTSCTRCGSAADILDGTYKIRDSKLEELSGPSLTIQVAQRLGIIVDKAKQDKGISAAEIVAEIADVSPELAEKIATRGWGVWALLLLLIWLIKSVELNVALDMNRLIDQIQGIEHSDVTKTDFDEYPIPDEAIINKPKSQTIVAGPKATSPNRKERRRTASLQKRGASSKG